MTRNYNINKKILKQVEVDNVRKEINDVAKAKKAASAAEQLNQHNQTVEENKKARQQKVLAAQATRTEKRNKEAEAAVNFVAQTNLFRKAGEAPVSAVVPSVTALTLPDSWEEEALQPPGGKNHAS